MAREKAEQLNDKRIEQVQKNAELNYIFISRFAKNAAERTSTFYKRAKTNNGVRGWNTGHKTANSVNCLVCSGSFRPKYTVKNYNPQYYIRKTACHVEGTTKAPWGIYFQCVAFQKCFCMQTGYQTTLHQ